MIGKGVIIRAKLVGLDQEHWKATISPLNCEGTGKMTVDLDDIKGFFDIKQGIEPDRQETEVDAK